MDLIQRSIEIIEDGQDKSGAFVACPRFENYRFSWLRDSSFIIYALCRWDRFEPAKKALRWNASIMRQQEEKIALLENKIDSGKPPGLSDFLPARYHLNGAVAEDDWPAFQTDGYGAWLWAAAEYIRLRNDTAFIHEIRSAVDLSARYLRMVWMLPSFDCWEEYGDALHPSSLACIYGGCRSLGDLIDHRELHRIAGLVKTFLFRVLEKQQKIPKYLGSPLTDASALWLTLPFGLFEEDHPLIRETVAYIETNLVKNIGTKRYVGDTYYGGGSWLILSAWLGWYYLRTGRRAGAEAVLHWIEAQAGPDGGLPEQVAEFLFDETKAAEWETRWGKAAVPLLWSHAMYLIVAAEFRKSGSK